ncbi:hypothetical protein [Pseudogemmobacter faecipullorum]|uniref:Uncharacterized protein n=1 Tax=Pseudogemmobacter faecipullorum TaxID=2755041 RepID=A0ABS8CMS7_9RHOB|nr:hypothetical protein [Pseudogemmobacter faecipullorum]MCB5410473.1 hypothetical protein [Pseudogemmobacter faecipullorum]
MTPRQPYPEQLGKFMRRRRLVHQLEGLTAIALVFGAALLAACVGRAVLITLLNLTGPALPPGCC